MSVAPTHVQQARNELANAIGAGLADAERSARKRLAAAGVDPDATDIEDDPDPNVVSNANQDDDAAAVPETAAEGVRQAAAVRVEAGADLRSRPVGRRAGRLPQT